VVDSAFDLQIDESYSLPTMDAPNSPVAAIPLLPKSRGWLIFFGFVSLVVGVFAIALPIFAALAIAQVIGIFCVISGVFSIGAVVFGQEKHHRTTSVILAVIRLVVGLMLLLDPTAGVLSLAIVLGIFFIAEGLVFTLGSFRGPTGHPKWLMLINGLVAFVLGIMIFAHFPSDAPAIIGLLYGINSIFYGITLLALASAAKPSVTA
jgi:uncharacterized membrane protein HdeD (DUF308 family)